MKRLNRVDIPPVRPGCFFVLRLKGEEKRVFSICSAKIFGVETHWTKQGTRPCVLPHSECQGHVNGDPLRWKGYLHVFDHKERAYVMLELTPRAANMLIEQTPNRPSLRGTRIQVARSRSGKGRLVVDILPPAMHLNDLAPEESPVRSLLNLWELRPSDVPGEFGRMMEGPAPDEAISA